MPEFPRPHPTADHKEVAQWAAQSLNIADRHLTEAIRAHRSNAQKFFRLAAETYEVIHEVLTERDLYHHTAAQARELAFSCRQGEASGFLDLSAPINTTKH